MSKSFTEENADFVLKITLEGNNGGDRQTRRIRLPKVVDDSGMISYEELVGLAIRFTFPEDQVPTNPADYKVQLTYHDVDEDLIHLGSTDELLDAVDQYIKQKYVRIYAKVERRRRKEQEVDPSLSRASVDASTQVDGSSAHSSSLSSDIPPPPPSAENNTQEQLNTVVESIVKILGAASIGINGQKIGSTIGPKVAFAFSQARKTDNTKPSPSLQEEVKEEAVSSVADIESDEATEETKNCKPAEASVTVEPKPKKEEENKVEDKPKPNEVEANPPEQPNEDEEEPFIHGRHTCDICLVTPIVGKRYHAVNLPDYDLCAKCKNNYKGDEINFEAVELDRDRPLQQRWRRRRARWVRQQNRGKQGRRGANATRGGQTSAPQSNPPKDAPKQRRDNVRHPRPQGGPVFGRPRISRCGPFPHPQPPHYFPHPFHPNGHAPPPFPHHMPPSFPHQMPPLFPQDAPHPPAPFCNLPPHQREMDDALKEAIRRSLQDVNVNTDEVRQEGNDEKPEEKDEKPEEKDKKMAENVVCNTEETGAVAKIEEPVISLNDDAQVDQNNEAHITSVEEKEPIEAETQEKKDDTENKAVVSHNEKEVTVIEEKDGSLESNEDDQGTKAPGAEIIEEKDGGKITANENIQGIKVTAAEIKEEKDGNKKTTAAASNAETKEGDKKMEGIKIFREKKVPLKQAPPSTLTLKSQTPAELEEASVSFSSDAEGHGSVAVALGETLDKCADAINEMVSELGRSSLSVEESDDESVETLEDNSPDENSLEEKSLRSDNMESEFSVEDEISSVESLEDENMEQNDTGKADSVTEPSKVVDGGATILDSVKSPPGVEEDSEADSFTSSIGGWQVVNEDNSDGGSGGQQDYDADTKDEDEAIALAAQLIGSSLFNSEMSRSGENLSTLSGSASSGITASVSMASSVPTNVASITSEPSLTPQQRSRWVSQLAQLKELGFDEVRCVEVLERLTAANIGVGASEEVTVAQVVNELFK